VEGVGYAIGTNEAAPLIQQLVTSGFVTRPFLGVTMAASSQPGVLLQGVQPGSPADAAGLKAGDVIVRFGGKDVRTIDELRQSIHQARIGESYEIVYERQGIEAKTSATLVASPGP
jgi:putative serine protease PepD